MRARRSLCTKVAPQTVATGWQHGTVMLSLMACGHVLVQEPEFLGSFPDASAAARAHDVALLHSGGAPAETNFKADEVRRCAMHDMTSRMLISFHTYGTCASWKSVPIYPRCDFVQIFSVYAAPSFLRCFNAYLFFCVQLRVCEHIHVLGMSGNPATAQGM